MKRVLLLTTALSRVEPAVTGAYQRLFRIQGLPAAPIKTKEA